MNNDVFSIYLLKAKQKIYEAKQKIQKYEKQDKNTKNMIILVVLCFTMLLPDVPWNNLTQYVPGNMMHHTSPQNAIEDLWIIIGDLGLTAVYVRTCLAVLIATVFWITHQKVITHYQCDFAFDTN